VASPLAPRSGLTAFCAYAGTTRGLQERCKVHLSYFLLYARATRRTEERVSHLGKRIKRNGRHSLSTPFLRPRLIYKQVQGQAQTRKESPPLALQREVPESAPRRHLSMRTATTSPRARKHNQHSSLVPTSFIPEVKPPITDRFLNRCCFAARVPQLVQTFMRLG